MRRLVVLLAGAAVLALCVAGCGATASSSSGGGDDAAPAVARSARAFLQRYVAADGRVHRTDQGDDTVSEGQAYGMLVAAGIGDWDAFDAIWRWTRAHLRRDDGLLASHWAGGRVVDEEAATDADLDAARALLVAGCRRGRDDLRSAGVALGRAVLAHETARRGGHEILAAGPWATGQPVTVNPSYLDPVTLRALAAATGEQRFEEVAADGRALIARVAKPLPPDWATVDADGRVHLSGPPGKVVPASFGFDAARTLVRLAEDPSGPGRRLAAAAWPVFRGRPAARLVVQHQLDGSPIGGARNPVAQIAAAGAAHAAGDDRAARALLDAAARLDARDPTYYGAAWVALGRLFLTTDRLQPCTAGA